MTYSIKNTIGFVLLNLLAASSFAIDVSNDFPNAFNHGYYLQANGELSTKSGKNEEGLEPHERSQKNGNLEWAVKSLPCSQNKAFKCVGIFKSESSKIQGNQMSPFSPLISDAGFTILRMNPEDSSQNSVIKCNSKFTQNMTRDAANLANCAEYSRSICKQWTDYIIQNEAEFSKVVDKVEECTDVMKSVDKININLRNIFQGKIKESEKDIAEAFDSTAHPNRKIVITTNVEFSQSKLSPHISTYKEMLDRTQDCRKYEDFFAKGFKGTGSQARLSSSVGGAVPSGKPSITKPVKTKN